jgi:hypothetical protein
MKFLLTLVLSICVASAEEREKRVGVGAIPNIDRISVVHIENIMAAHGIEAVIWGTVFWGIEVPPAKKAEAFKLLKRDAPRRNYVVLTAAGKIGKKPESSERLRRIRVRDALKMPEYSQHTSLGRFLRNKEVAALTAKLPFIQSLEVAERQYRITPTELSDAYEIELTLRSTLGARGQELRDSYQVMNHGRTVEFNGVCAGPFQDAQPTR